jgi:hypothetical protein
MVALIHHATSKAGEIQCKITNPAGVGTQLQKEPAVAFSPHDGNLPIHLLLQFSLENHWRTVLKQNKKIKKHLVLLAFLLIRSSFSSAVKSFMFFSRTCT